jgi:integrase
MGNSRSFGNIRKLPSGRYQVRYRHLGRLVPGQTTYATKAEAKIYLAAIETDLNRGTYVDPDTGRVRFSDYATQWLDHRQLRPRTRETYESQMKHILATFGDAQLNAIKPTDVRAWHGKLVKSELHPNTVSKVYRQLRTILGTAVDDGLLPSNPAHIRGAAKESVVERPLLDWDDVARLASAIHPRFEALVWTAATSGLRFGELSGLTIGHIDLEQSEIRVSQSLAFQRGDGPTIGPPKSDSAHRTVAIPVEISGRLKSHIEEFADASRVDSLVFTSLKGSPLLNRYFAPYWRRARTAANLEKIRFHDLRHLAGTEAASAGASLREVMARMGHSSSDASLRYLKASEARDREVSDAISERMRRARR